MNNSIVKTAGRLPSVQTQSSPQQRLGFPIIGKIKIGEEKGENRPGKAIDWFRATGQYADQFHKEYGDRPNKLMVVFPSPDPELVCCNIEEGRDGKGRLCAYFDGLHYRLFDKNSSNYRVVSENEYNDAKQKGIPVLFGYGKNQKEQLVKIENWRTRLVLRFILPKLKGIMGVWELSTGATESSIPAIIQIFDNMLSMAGDAFNRVPFDLTVSFHTSNKPGEVRKFPVVNILPNMGFENTLQLKEFAAAGHEFNRILTDSIFEEQEQLLLNPTSHKQLAQSNLPGIKDNEEVFEAKEIAEAVVVDQPKKEEFDPKALKSFVRERGEKFNAPISMSNLKLVNICLSVFCSYNDELRKQVIEYLTGKTSSKDLTDGEADAIIKFIPVEKDDEQWLPARAEAPEQFKILVDSINAATKSVEV